MPVIVFPKPLDAGVVPEPTGNIPVALVEMDLGALTGGALLDDSLSAVLAP